MTKYAERLKEIEARAEELKNLPETATAEELEKAAEELRSLKEEKRALIAKQEISNTDLKEEKEEVRTKMSEREERAKKLVETGRLEIRTLLSTGTIAKPTKVGEINGIADGLSSIVDDVKAIALEGNGTYISPLKTANASAVDVTDGEEIGGTGATFGTVEISPSEWGIVDSISNQVKKMTPVNYEVEVENSAVIALRAKAQSKIVAAILDSAHLGNQTIALDQKFLRTLLISHKSIAGKGANKLYLTRNDLITLGDVRGTNEKRPLYTIEFTDNGANMSGVISEGGSSVAFSIVDDLTDGTQLYGQPQTVEMPMWGNYVVETDESVFFTKNLIALRGLQTANAALCAVEGMVKVTQASA